MMRVVLLAVAAFLGAWMSSDAEAQAGAPFCMVWAGGSNCSYLSLPACQRAAQSAGGGCVVNQQRDTQVQAPPVQNYTPYNPWNAFEQGARIGANARQARQNRERADLTAAVRQFCSDMAEQDSAELERMTAAASAAERAEGLEGAFHAEWDRKFIMFTERSDRCYALIGVR